MRKYEKLLQPLQVAGLRLKNRMLSAPTSLAELGPGEHYSDDNINYYKLKASGGVALVSVGDTIVDLETGRMLSGAMNKQYVWYENHPESGKRFEGFQQACLDADIPTGCIHYAEPENDALVLPLVKEWIAQGVTGLFSFCDVEAWHLVTMLESAGYRPGRDLSIIGFDNILRYISYPKPICSIDCHLQEEACTAIDLLRKRIHDPSLPPQQVVLPVSLVCRDSCRRP